MLLFSFHDLIVIPKLRPDRSNVTITSALRQSLHVHRPRSLNTTALNPRISGIIHAYMHPTCPWRLLRLEERLTRGIDINPAT